MVRFCLCLQAWEQTVFLVGVKLAFVREGRVFEKEKVLFAGWFGFVFVCCGCE